jgi:hypothetical protein
MSNEEFIAFIKKNVIPVACVLASIAIGLVLYFRSDALPEAEKVLAQKTQEGELFAANIEDAEHLPEQQKAILASNDDIENRMIRVGQLAENLQYFYQLESDTGTKLTPVQVPWNPPPKAAAKTNFTTVSFTLTAQGEYRQLVDLLRKLENGEHYCRIDTCSMRPLSEVRGGPLTMSLSLELLANQ